MLEKFKYSNKPEWFQSILNLPYYSKECPPIHADGVDYIVQDGFKFYPRGPLTVFSSVYKNTWFDLNTLSTDNWTFLDIGACIGTVAIPMAQKFKKVIAIEPIWDRELRDNIDLNNIKNIEVYRQCVGRIWLAHKEVEYAGYRRSTEVVPLKALIELYKPDYIKCDIEGEEWNTPFEAWLGPEELRIEFHTLRGKEKWCSNRLVDFVFFMLSNRYLSSVDYSHKEQSLRVARTIYFSAHKDRRRT